MNRREFAVTSSLGIIGSFLFGCTKGIKFPFKKDQVIACLGDSVTYGGKNGYVEMLQIMADEKRPDLNLKFLNWGKSSETVTGLTEVGHPGPRPYLFERLDELLDSTTIDVVLFCYGINCGIYGKPSEALFNKYKIGVYSFLEKVKQKGISAILLTPPPLTLDTAPIAINTNTEYTWLNPYPNYDKEVLEEFKRIILNMDHDVILTSIDIHQTLLLNQAECYDNDPIHPNSVGHRLIATTVIEKLGF